METEEVVEVLEEIAHLLEIQGANPFKVRAYTNGARALEQAEDSVETLVAEERLGELEGFGDALTEKVTTLVRTGRLPYYDDLRAKTPDGLLGMLEVSGLGGKSIHKFYKELGIETLPELKAACQDGRVAGLSGFGRKSAAKILDGIENLERYAERHLLPDAEERAFPILEGLRALPGVERAAIAGSLRRRRETVGDLDFLAEAADPEPVMEWFVGREEVSEVLARGTTKSSVRFGNGLQADLRVVDKVTFPSALHHFTGSKQHNILLRQRALERGWSLSEWGLQAVDGENGERETVHEEEELFARLGLAWIPPELREGRDEIERAERGELPDLVRLSDLRGALHNHTTASDGHASLEEMARAAGDLGWDYLGIADHSPSSFQANGLSPERLLAQVGEIRRLNEGGELPVHLFSGTECDILKDGSLDFADEVLAELDYVVVSIHQGGFGQDRDTVTRRIVRALEHPAVTLLAHPTGRLLLQREPYPVDMTKVVDAAAANGKWIEINANPRRLDMDWREWARAREKGVLAITNPDAHRPEHLAYVRYGIDVARKGGLSADDLVNTRTLAEMRKLLGR